MKVVRILPIPLLVHEWSDTPDLNRALRSTLLEARGRSAGVQVSNRGGWHSSKDLGSWSQPCIAELLDRVRVAMGELVMDLVADPAPELLENWEIEAWAVVNERGDWNVLHHHDRRGSVWSGVYMVDPGGPPESAGALVFENGSLPRPEAAERVRDGSQRIESRAGQMVLFPAAIPHRVEPHGGGAPRIAIAFNLSHAHFTTSNGSVKARVRQEKRRPRPVLRARRRLARWLRPARRA